MYNNTRCTLRSVLMIKIKNYDCCFDNSRVDGKGFQTGSTLQPTN
jgi:hypothetical protein